LTIGAKEELGAGRDARGSAAEPTCVAEQAGKVSNRLPNQVIERHRDIAASNS
jgi:hypothetical protein